MRNRLVVLLSSVFVAVAAALVNTASAGAAAAATPTPSGGADPTQIGNNLKSVVSPNAKAFWWVLLVCGVLFMAASRKAGRAAATGVALVISGIVIYNPGGVGSMMQGFADKILPV
jgi:hypothetical protein